MAGDWIKMRHDLVDDPAVIALTEQTDCVDESHVIGTLHKLWCWADRQTTNGHAPSVTLAWLDRYLGVPGFAEVLQKVGWLRKKGTGFVIPHFDTHISQSAKKRALAGRRMAKNRSRKRDASSVTKARPEKSRVEKSIPPVVPRGISVGLDLERKTEE